MDNQQLKVLNIDYVVCPYCGAEMERLTNHTVKVHGKSKSEVLKDFPGCKLQCEKLVLKLSRINSEISNRESVRKAKSDAQHKLYEGDSELKKYISKKSKEMWDTEGHRERVIESLKISQNSAEVKKKIADADKRRWSDKEYHKRVSKKIRDTQNLPEKKNHMSKITVGNYLSGSFDSTLKEYTINNQVYKLRSSYEADFIKILLDNGIDFVYEPFKVKYTSCNRYIPDFYIKSRNLVVEVKPNFICEEKCRTLYPEMYKEVCEKAKAVLRKGFNFIFITEKELYKNNNVLDLILSETFSSTTNRDIGVGTDSNNVPKCTAPKQMISYDEFVW